MDRGMARILGLVVMTLALGPACDRRWTVHEDRAELGTVDLATQDLASPDLAPDLASLDTAVPDATVTDMPPPTGWIVQAGCKDKYSKISIWDMAHDGLGNSAVLGHFVGQACIGGSKLNSPTSLGADDSFVARVDATGTFSWTAHMIGYNHVQAYAVAMDKAGNTYVAGTMDGDLDHPQVTFGTITRQCGPTGKPHNGCFFVARLDAAGKYQWVLSGNDKLNGISIRDMGLDAKGQVHITGMLRGSATLGAITLKAKGTYPTHADLYVARLSPAGKWLQASTFGSVGWNWWPKMAVDGAGYRYVAQNFKGQASVGSKALTSKGAEDVYVARVNPAGKVQWVVTAGGAGRDSVNAVALASAGDLVLTGDIRTPAAFGPHKLKVNGTQIEAFVARISKAGKFLWATASSGSGGEWARDIAVDATGNIAIAGSYKDTARFGSVSFSATGDSPDGFVARLDKNGKFTKAKSWGSADHDRVGGVALDGASSVYVAGTLHVKTTFDKYTLVPGSFWDLYVWKIPPAAF